MPWHYLQDKKKKHFWCFIGVYAATNPKKKNLFEKKKKWKCIFCQAQTAKKKNAISCYAWQIKPVNPVFKESQSKNQNFWVKMSFIHRNLEKNGKSRFFTKKWKIVCEKPMAFLANFLRLCENWILMCKSSFPIAN